jgi:hypothetical protein
MTIKYVDEDATLVKFLMLGRDYYEFLRHPVYKQALMRSSQEKLKQKRAALWLRLLEIPHGS